MASNDRYINIGMGLDIQDLRTGLSEAKREMALAESEFKAATAGLDKWDESIDGVIAKLDQMAKEMQAKEKIVQAYRAELQRVTDLYGENSKQAQEVQTKLNNAEASYTKAQKYTEELKKKLDDLKTAETNAKTASDNLKGSIAKAGDESKTASTKIKDHLTDALDKVKQSAEKAAKDGFDSLKGKVEGFVTGALSKATNALKDFIKQTVQLGIDFSGTMSTVQALSGASADEMAVLEKAAREAGASTTFSAVEAAEALKYMSLAGWDAQQSTEALGGILDLAAASGMGLAEASDAVTDNLTAFGMEAAESARLADMLAYAQANANTSADQLIAAYKNAAPTLASAGQSVETVTATLAVLSNSGIKGGEAGTALAAVMRDITKRMEDGAVQIGNTSVKVADQEGNFRSLTDILGDVAGAVDGLGTAERSQALSATFTADSIKAVNTILNTGTEEVGKYEKALKSSDGAAKEMAKTMNDNLGGDLKQLNSVLDEIKLALFDLIEGPLREIVKALTEILKHSDTVTDGVAKGFGNVTTKFEGASKGIDALVNADWDGIAKGAEDAWNGMTQAFAGAGQWAGGVWDKIKGAFSDPSGAFKKIGGSIYSAFTGAWSTASSWASGILNSIADVFKDPGKTLQNVGGQMWGALKAGWTGIETWATGVFNSIKGVFNDPAKTLQGIGGQMWSALKAGWTNVTNWATGIFDTIKGVFKDPSKTLQNVGGQMWQSLKNGWTNVTNWATGIFNSIKGVFNDPAKTLQSVGGQMWQSLKNGWTNVTSWATGVFNSIKGAFTSSASTLQSVGEQMWSALKAGWTNVTGWATNVFNSIKGIFNDPNKTLQNIGGQMWSSLKAGWTGISSWASGVLGTINSALGDPAGTISATGSNLWNKLKGAFSGVGGWFTANVYNPMTGAFNGLAAWATNTFGGVWNAISNAFSPVVGFFTNIYDGIMKALSPVLQFFGIKTDGYDPLAGIKQQITASEAEVKRLKSVYDTAYTNYQTKRSTYGYSSSITTEAQKAYNSAYTAWNTARQELQKLQNSLNAAEREQESGGLGDVSQSISSAFSGVKDAITKPFTDAWNTITGLFSGIGDWFSKNVVKPIQDALKPVGQAVSGGVAGGMVDAKKGITTGTQTLGGWIVGGICDVLGIHSPSKVMHDRVGLMIGAGVAEGIADSARSVRAASEALGASVALPGGMGGGQAMRGPATVVYNQTINSPEPLTVGQIYRDTRSLIGRREWA